MGLLWQIMFQKKITKFYHLGNFLKSFKLKNAWNLNLWSVTRSSSSGTKLPTLAQTLLVGPKRERRKKVLLTTDITKSLENAAAMAARAVQQLAEFLLTKCHLAKLK